MQGEIRMQWIQPFLTDGGNSGNKPKGQDAESWLIIIAERCLIDACVCSMHNGAVPVVVLAHHISRGRGHVRHGH